MNAVYDKETATAKAMQLALMPSAESIATIEKNFLLQTASCFLCSSELSGDFWGCKTLSDDELALYICDFSGHGIASAINTFRFHALLEYQMEQYGSAPAHFIELLNQQLTKLLPAEQFTTAFYGVLHTGLDTLFYVAAGAPPPLLLRANGTIEWIDSSGLPLGIRENAQYRLQEISFLPEDLLLFYSDSLIEQKLPSGEKLNETRIAEIITHTASSRPNHLPQAILEALLKYFRNEAGETIPLADDLTINIYLRQ